MTIPATATHDYGPDVHSIELENKHLKEEVTFYKKKLGTIAKPSSNGINPQGSVHQIAHQTSINFA